MKNKVLIVDGHNVIFKIPELKALKEGAIERLVNILNSSAFLNFDEIWVVFDAQEKFRTTQEVGRVRVVMAAKEETADSVIIEILSKLEGKYSAWVVSDDYAVQLGSLKSAQLRMTTREFISLSKTSPGLRKDSKKERRLMDKLSKREKDFLENLYFKLVRKENEK